VTARFAGPADVPVDVGRDEAQRMAARELADPRYHADDPSLLQRGAQWVLEHLADLLHRAGGVAPGGYAGLLLLVVIVAAAVVAVRLTVGRVGRLGAAVSRMDPPFEQTPRSAAQYRQAADSCAAHGAWALAVRERLRAIMRDLEQRDLLAVQPGRTAHEAAAQAGVVLPGCAADLLDAARIFDEVWYGGHPATAEMDGRLRAVDEATRRARPAVPAR
jgi:hypothetical protein